jgi:hypothetical protein
MHVDHNPDDLGLISRNFEDPHARLLNFAERVKDQYLKATIGAGYVDKYLYELYYDIVFVKEILSKLGVLPKTPRSVAEPFASSVEAIVNTVIDKVIAGEVTKEP